MPNLRPQRLQRRRSTRPLRSESSRPLPIAGPYPPLSAGNFA